MLVGVHREFAVDGQQQPFSVAAGQADGKLDPFLRAGYDRRIDGILSGSQQLGKQRFQLDFTPDAAGFHALQYALEVAHAAGQRLHFAQSAMHLLQLAADLLEGLAQPLFQRAGQLPVDEFAHFG